MFEFFAAIHTVFTGIILQALPFLLLGALLSSILHIFVPESYLIKVFPKKYGLGFLTALFAGLLFPICECASVPLMRSLIKKGIAMPIAVTFMLASPIVNPISIISTVYAFPQQPSAALYRLYFGLVIAFATGLVLLFYPEETYLREDFAAEHIERPETRHVDPLNGSAYRSAPELQTVFNAVTGRRPSASQTASGERLKSIQDKLYTLLTHTCSEFFTAGPFLIIGAFFTALIRTSISQALLSTSTGTAAGSLLLMMLFAFAFSACSTSDAFIARSFLNRFSFGAILGFLVYGPMMDVKNLFMLLSLFKKRFVIELTIIITIMNFIGISIFVRLFF